MTTGRINQVTILRPPHAAQQQPAGTKPAQRRPWNGPEDVCYKEGAPARSGAGTRPGALSELDSPAAAPKMGHPIAPTVFPKERSAVDAAERLASRPQSAACALPVEETRPQSTPKGGYWLGRAPEDLA
jgi:hypothetical protein